jgi:cytochrome c biogenesis protein CcmG/thiol:disulfide interchange protein DsbE
VTPAKSNKLIRNIVLTCALALVVASCATTSGGAGFEYRPDAEAVALPAPAALQPASLREFEGMLVAARGRPVVVNVWASWCGPCRVESPLLARAARSYADRVAFIGVDSRDDENDGRAFIARYRLDYPHVFDATGEIRARLRLRGFPTTYIFGRDGSLRYRVVGGISEQELAARVEDLLRS